MTLAIGVSFVLLLIAAISLITGISTLRYVDMTRNEKITLGMLSIFTFLWCGGYGMQYISTSTSQAMPARGVAVVGVIGFIMTAIRFLHFFCGKNNKLFEIIWIVDLVAAVFTCVLLEKPGTVVFVNSGYGMTFRSPMNIARIVSVGFVVFNAVWCILILTYGYRNAVYHRSKKIITLLFAAGTYILCGSILDLLLPMLGKIAFPASCIGVFLSLMTLIYMAVRLNAFSITKANMSRYIFENAQTPVLVIGDDEWINMGNVSAEHFFETKFQENKLKLQDLFEITSSDAKRYLATIEQGSTSESSRMVSRVNDAVCELVSSPVKDEYGETICVVSFIYDMTKDYNAMETMKQMKNSLELQLDEKTKQVETMALQAITTIANFIDSKEEYTIGHSTRVAHYAQLLAKEIGWDEEETKNIYYVGLLHDIGKIGVPYDILNKPTRLTKEEYELIKKHTMIGSEILKDVQTVDNVEYGALFHHERYDGNGYPKGLKGNDIPIVARIIGLADAYDAMTSNRQYRKHLDMKTVVEELEKNAGAQFDPFLASTMVRMIREGSLQVVEEQSDQTSSSTILAESNLLMARVFRGEITESLFHEELDTLTQVWNRRTGERHMEEYLMIGDGALMILDLDNFAEVNDLYGEETGDEILKAVADILRKHTKYEFLCRMASDEFAIFVRDVVSKEQVKSMADAIMYSYNNAKEGNPLLDYTSISMGIALSCVEGRDYQQLVRCADRALYHIKMNEKGGYGFHVQPRKS